MGKSTIKIKLKKNKRRIIQWKWKPHLAVIGFIFVNLWGSDPLSRSQSTWKFPTLNQLQLGAPAQDAAQACPVLTSHRRVQCLQGRQVPLFALYIPISMLLIMLFPAPIVSFLLISICPNPTNHSRFSQNTTLSLSGHPAENHLQNKTSQFWNDDCRHSSQIFPIRQGQGVEIRSVLHESHCWQG